MTDSRYSATTVTTIDYGFGPRPTMVPSVPLASRVFDFVYYQFTGADRLDRLAEEFYGDPEMWWKIADANPEILDWMNLSAGTTLRVPSG